MKLKSICKLIVGTPVNVFSQSHHDYLAWACSPECVSENFGEETVVEIYTVHPERRDLSPYLTIVVA